MPSPFPGMDPWLEGHRWIGFHNQLVPEIGRQLTPQITPRYYAETTERILYADPGDIAISAPMYPDVAVHEAATDTKLESSASAIAAPVELRTLMQEEIPHYAVEIRDVEQRRLVTSIEVFSPANKPGREDHKYLRKRQRLLASTAHILEIDLHRAGRRVPMIDDLPAADYFVFLSRAEKRPIIQVWPIDLHDPLPKVSVPLLPGDEDAILDLQAAFTTVYDSLAYRNSLNYSAPPPVPLDEEDAAWTEECLRKAGLWN